MRLFPHKSRTEPVIWVNRQRRFIPRSTICCGISHCGNSTPLASTTQTSVKSVVYTVSVLILHKSITVVLSCPGMEAYVFVEHSADCPHLGNRFYRKCRCRKWIYVAGERKRFSAKTRSWETAEKEADKLRKSDAVLPSRGVTIEHAISDYLSDKRQQNISDGWMERLELLLSKGLSPWCQRIGIEYLADLDIAALKDFRATWTGNPLTRSKKQERLRSFLLYCQRHGWIQDNPAALLSRIKVDRVPTDYFTQEEFRAILAAVESYHPKGTPDARLRARQRAGAMILLLRWSGLRLGDAARLERRRLDKNGRLFLYMAKTGEPVYVPLPADVAESMRALPNSNPRYFFWTGNGDPKTTVDDWWRTLSRVFKHAKLGKRAHPHMFRDTFAVELLLSGVPIEQVSQLLGHSSIKITEKHYAPWVKARQEQLEQSVRKAWARSNS